MIMKKKEFLTRINGYMICGLVMLSVYACNKNEVSSSRDTGKLAGANTTSAITATTNPFNVFVGAPVDVITGNKWIDNYKLSNRGLSKEYLMAAADLKSILSDPNCVGICLYFAIDDNQTPHLLPIGVNSKGIIMKTKQINTSLGPIYWGTALKWIANDLGAIDARFFGRNTFNRLFNTPNCLNIRAISAEDDQHKPQLLLANAAYDYYKMDSKIAGQFLYEDDSSPCPPVCGLEQL